MTTLLFALDWRDDSRFKVILALDEATTPTLAADTSPSGNPMTSGNGVGNTNRMEGARAWEITSAGQALQCLSGDSCTASDFYFTSGDFTAGLWIYPAVDPGLGPFNQEDVGLTTTPLYPNLMGWAMLYYNVSSTHRFAFWINDDSPAFGTHLSSTTTFALEAWHHHVVRYTDADDLMEQVINGTLDASTASSTSPGIDPTTPVFRHATASSKAYVGSLHDEEWVFAGKMTATDICRITICQIDGQTCQCDWGGTPANYADRPRHSADGGAITCTMPACDKAAPD